jgi:putative transposase
MSRSKHTEAQIIAALKQVEAGRTVDDVARECGVSQATIYTWKAKFGGMDVSEAQRLRSLEDENSRLKRLVADLSLDKEMLKAVIAKKRVELVDRRTDASWLGWQYRASERRVCGLMSIAVSSYRYQSRRSDESLREKLVRLGREKPRYGYRRLQVLVEREGERVNHKRLWRVYREAGLCLKRKKRKHCVRIRSPRPVLSGANQEWALDFAHDVLAAGRMIRVLSVVDVYTRECLALEVDTGFASRRVTRVLDEIIATRGRPQAIRCDNGPELTSRHFLAWALDGKIELRHIQPGKPTQNAHVESFHGRLREECLRVGWFTNLFDARRKISTWKAEYNEQRPHSSLGYKTPAEFARVAITQSYGNDVSFAHLENACGVSHFPSAPAAG